MTKLPAALILPLAHGNPAGGAALDQVAIATGGALVIMAAIAWLALGHRRGSVPYLGRAAAFAERHMNLPGWCALPSGLSLVSLLVAVLGMYWDISLHIDVGRDPGPLANSAHYLIILGLFGIFAAGCFAMALPKSRPSPTAVRIRGDWYAPLGGILITACGAFALIGFPLDDLWHRLFGQDVTLWGPTHLMMIGGAGMTLVGQAVLLVEGSRARAARRAGDRTVGDGLVARLRRAVNVSHLRRGLLMGGLLIGLSTFQGEFDFGVPQFRFVLEPVLLAVAASVALVAARLWIGRGGALIATGVFLAVRGAIALIVHQAFGQSLPHLPLYLAEAGLVELAALTPLVRRPLAFGAVAGLLIGTVGFAAEWGWSQFAMPIAWSADLFPEAMILAVVAALAGGLVGSLLAGALDGRLPSRRVARAIPIVALVAILGIFTDGLWTTVPKEVRAHVTLHTLRPGPNREVSAAIRFDPAGAASDPAWLNVTDWQGGGLVVDKLTRRPNGSYQTTQPIPVYGEWKTTIRLHRAHEILGLPIHMPTDPEIPWAPGVAAKHHFTRSFVNDHQLLQREQKPGVASWLRTAAPVFVLVFSLGFLSLLAWGLGRLGRSAERERVPARQRVPRPRPTVIPTGART
jgi:hypothetical protein